VKLIVNLKLTPLDSQKESLKQTLIRANAACDEISARAFEAKIFKQFNLHKLVYHPMRGETHLASAIVVRAIAKVADSYKLDKQSQRRFNPLGSFPYDEIIISFRKDDMVSIWSVDGRLHIPFVMGDAQRELFSHRQGEVKLMLRKGVFYLNCVCDVPEETLFDPKGVLGVDFGIVNIVTDSDGEQFSGKDIERVRQTFSHRRRNLQRKQTKASKRKLKQLAGKQSAYQKLQNHIISKSLIAKAKGTERAIALEDLSGIRDRITVRRSQRNRMNNWSFSDLKQKIEYKAKLNGVTVIAVDPRNTSRQCSKCSHIAKSNRKSQSSFVCQNCGFTDNADSNASRNIRDRAAIQQPNETSVSR
jgi:IS605 OrfB family transposase